MNDKNGRIWDFWSRKKVYNRPHLYRYYRIRERNLQWLTSKALSLLEPRRNLRILKADLWNEAKKEERFFLDVEGNKFGLDLSIEICQMAKTKHGGHLHLLEGSIAAIPFKENSFDLILDISTIDHFDCPERVVEEYFYVLGQGGVLLLVAENPFCLSYPVTKIQSFLNLHVPFKGFLPSRLSKAVRRSGFQIVDRFMTNIHLPTVIVYLLERKGVFEDINRGRNFFWNFCKKYFVVLARKV